MLRFYYSDSDLALEKRLFELIAEKLGGSSSPAQSRVLLIVPAQFTLEAERKAFEALGGKGFLDLHVVSGNKLEHDILHETGGPGAVPVNTLGRAMLLRRVSLQHRDELKAFGRLAGKKDFLELAGDFIVQMKQNRIAAEDLPGIMELCGEDSILRAKLADMRVIYSAYEEAMQGRFTDSEDLLSFVRGKVCDSSLIAGADLFYYGFYSFTKSEAQFIAELAKRARSLNMMLLKGREGSSDEEIYAAPRRAAELIKMEASMERVSFREEECADPGSAACELHLTACASGFTQAETIALRALELERRGFGFGEMAVLTADDDALKKTIAGRLEAFGVPVFMDEKRKLTDDPAVRLCSALLGMAADGVRKDHVLGLLKCGLAQELFGCDRHTADDLENYLDRYHIRGSAFASPFIYGRQRYGEERFEALDALRGRVSDFAAPFLERFRSAESCAEKCAALCGFLRDEAGLPALLEAKALELAGAGMQDPAEETAQSWGALCGILDQAVELVGSEAMSAEEFRDMIESSIADVKIGLLPQSENRVQLGSVSRSMLSGVRALFIADLNDGVIPSDGWPETLLTQNELAELSEKGISAGKTHGMLSGEEELQIHMLLRKPVEYLHLSWCESDDQGGAAAPSRLIASVLAEHTEAQVEADAEASGSDLPFLQGRKNAAARIAGSFRNSLDTYGDLSGVSPELKLAYDELLAEGAPELAPVADALLYSSEKRALGSELSRDLYGRGSELSFSPTQMENYGMCPFRHFVSYGLRPEDPRRFELDHITIGSVYHEALMRLSKRLSEPSQREGKEISDPGSLWSTVSDEELSAMLSEILAELAETGFDGIMQAGDGERYYSGRMLRSCLGFAKEMVRQVRAGSISSMYFETGFGRGRRFPAITVETAAGTVYVEGRIDRVDLMRGQGGDFIKVIDYKSGNKEFKKEEVERGLSLQLMTYLEGASAMSGAEPAGVFYFSLRDFSENAGLSDLAAGELAESVRKRIERHYKMSGLALSEPEPLGLIDRGIGESGTSTVIDCNIDAKSGVKGKNLVSREEFEEFRESFKATLSGICRGISEGDIQIRPQKLAGDRTSCDYCDYRSICLFGVGRGR